MAAAAVLAGGASRRMGRDKATMPVDGVELAASVLAAAARVAAPVVLVAPEGHPARRLAARVVADPAQGPLAALAAAFETLDAAEVLVLAGDHPGLRVELLAHLVALAPRGEAVACRRGPRLEPLVAVYRRVPALAAARRALAGGSGGLKGSPPVGRGSGGRKGSPPENRGSGREGGPARRGSMVGLLAELRVVVVEESEWRALDPDGRSFVDLDDPADLAAWETTAAWSRPSADDR
jgi:molybdopterin-guanine dinucleotide biosynthesis protein A